jgi:hypothetical protein
VHEVRILAARGYHYCKIPEKMGIPCKSLTKSKQIKSMSMQQLLQNKTTCHKKPKRVLDDTFAPTAERLWLIKKT